MNFIKNKPIYLQIAHDLILKMINGEIKTATLLPSVRELSVLYGVTPKTIQSVTLYLSEQGVITRKAGVGSVVTTNLEILNVVHNKYGEEMTLEYIESMRSIGFDQKRLLDMIKDNMEGNND